MSTTDFIQARDFLLRHRADYDTAVQDFRWPVLTQFNWALDYFDAMARGNDSPALIIVEKTAPSNAEASTNWHVDRIRWPTTSAKWASSVAIVSC